MTKDGQKMVVFDTLGTPGAYAVINRMAEDKVVLAALKNALKLVKKDLGTTKIILNGAGAAGTAIARLLVLAGARNIIGFDSSGVISKKSASNNAMRKWFIDNCNPEQLTLPDG